MGSSEEGSYSFEMDKRVVEATRNMQKSIEIRSFYRSLLENPDGFPSYFLGIDGQLRRNDCAYRLALAIHSGLITYDGALDKLREFSNDIIEEGKWVQLPLWNHSELDQL